jgi:hypothetical protein
MGLAKIGSAFGGALLLAACVPQPDEWTLACDGYCDELAACGAGWEIGIDSRQSCNHTCYAVTEPREIECVDAADGCADVQRCLCYPLYAFLYEGCGIAFFDAHGDDLPLDEVVAGCELDDPEWGFGSPIADCLADASCAEADLCLDGVLGG